MSHLQPQRRARPDQDSSGECRRNLVNREEIDHKDERNNGRYGEVIKTGLLVGALQGAMVLVAGSILVWFMADWLRIPKNLSGDFFWLMTGQIVIASLSSIGLPFLNGFVGEFLIMLGSWTSSAVQHAWIVTMLAGTGVIWAAVYMLWMLQRVVFGTRTSEANTNLSDLNWRELGLVLPLIALMLFMGVFPGPFLSRSRASIEATRLFLLNPGVVGSIDLVTTEKHDDVR